MKSMNECKSKEEKNQLMVDLFHQVGLDPLEIYTNYNTKILCKISKKQDKYYSLKVRMSYSAIQHGYKWDFNSIIQEDKDKYIYDIFLKMGVTVIKNYHYINDTSDIPFIVNEGIYNSLKGTMRWTNVQQGKNWDFRSLMQEDKDKYTKSLFFKLGCAVDEKYHYKNSQDKVPFTIIDPNSNYCGLRGIRRWICAQRGQKWDFSSIIKEDQNKYIKQKFNENGIEPLESYTKMIKPILFIVIDKTSRYFGYKGKITPSTVILQNHSWNTTSLLPEEWKRFIRDLCNKLDYEIIKYPKNSEDKIIINTRNNNKWETDYNHILQGYRCPSDTCSSWGERCLNEIFKINNITFNYQKTIHHFDKSIQFMDFYLPEYNMCIEYNGKQHYEETNFTNLKKQQQQDLKKYKYCKQHNIKYCEIPFIYFNIDQITKYISKIINEKLIKPDYIDVQYSQPNRLVKNNENRKSYKNKADPTFKDKEKVDHSTYKQKPIIQLSLLYEVKCVYKSVSQSSNLNKYNQGNISKVCLGTNKTAYGYKWMYLKDYRKQHPEFKDIDVEKYMIRE
jgi:very-short-patch-repair endonuclease